MKLEKITHDHLLTKWLKVIIFAILMLAPIFSVAIRCAYVVCNKNAYQSYYGETINENEIHLITQKSDLQQGESYKLTPLSDTWSTYINESLNYIICEDLTYNGTTYNNVRLGFYMATNTTGIPTIYVRNITSNDPVVSGVSLSNQLIDTLNFTYTSISQDFNSSLLTYLKVNYYTYNKYSYLDNVFDYSVAQLKQDQLFNWTQNTGVYTGVNAMTTGLGLTDGTISILITYWTLLSIIYVIIDIVIEGFVALTHMILKKAS